MKRSPVRGQSNRSIGTPNPSAVPPPADDGLPIVHLNNLYLLSNDRGAPVLVPGVSLTFDVDGVAVSTTGDPSRTLPWASLSDHAVEPWTGTLIPEWWVDPELGSPGQSRSDDVIDPEAGLRIVPHTEPGALISLQTPFATYRFLVPGGRAEELAPKVADLTYSHQGPAGAPSATTVRARLGTDVVGPPPEGTTWRRAQPILVVLLAILVTTVAVLIVLQSAGTIHLPYLGGTNPALVGATPR